MSAAVRLARRLLPRDVADRYIEEWQGDSERLGADNLSDFALLKAALQVGWTLRLHRYRSTRETFMDDARLRARVLTLGLVLSTVMVGLGALIAPFAVAGLLGVGATFLIVAILRARAEDRRWWPVWVIGAASVVWAGASIVSWTYWGIAFDLSDAGRSVPAAVSAATFGAFGLGLLAFLALIVTGIYIAAARSRSVHA